MNKLIFSSVAFATMFSFFGEIASGQTQVEVPLQNLSLIHI